MSLCIQDGTCIQSMHENLVRKVSEKFIESVVIGISELPLKKRCQLVVVAFLKVSPGAFVCAGEH